MPLADWLRVSLWPETDLGAALRRHCDAAGADVDTTAARAVDLAGACELVDPDRRRAVGMYQLAWRLGGSTPPLTRAYELAREIGDHELLAGLALAAYEATRDVAHLLVGARAFVDSGQLALAEPALSRALQGRSDDEAKSLLAMMRKQIRDPQGEVSGWVARATRATGAEAARLFLHAARLARLAGLDAIFARHVDTAWQRGRDASAAMLIEADLVARRRASDLLAFYRQHVEAASGDREWWDRMRAAGTKLALAGVQRGLALRMLRSGLEGAYRARLVDIPGHLAAWQLLIAHAKETRSTRELMPLVVEALSLPLPDDDRLYLARFGFEVAWREAGERSAAEPYAAVITDLVPGDDGVGQMIAPRPAPPTAYEPPSAPLPPEPSIVKMKANALTALKSGNRKPGLPTSPPVPAQAARAAERIVVPADVEIRTATATFTAVVRDLSATGAYVVTDHEIDVDTLVTLSIELPGSDVLAVTKYEVSAKVVRRAYSGCGLSFVDPSAALVDAIAKLGAR